MTCPQSAIPPRAASAARPVCVRLRVRSAAGVCGAALLGVLATSGCMSTPAYERPTVEVPAAYRLPGIASASADGPSLDTLAPWWQGFGDAQLDALVDEALRANHDLGIAVARVDEFAARVTAARSAALPQLGYGVSSGRQRAPGIGASGTHAVGLFASWEIDLWGRLRSEQNAARAELMASEQARRGVALSVVASVVAGYITLLDLDRRLEIANATVAGRRASVALFQLRLDGGALSEFEMLQVSAEYESAVAAVPELQQALAEQENALSVLVGRNPGPIARGGTLETLQPPVPPAGLPSDLLARRPDILQSEQQLVAAHARIQVARALYFPSLSLTGQGGRASASLDDLFSGPSRTWSFVGQLLGPIFAGGAIDAANRQAQARNVQAVLDYQRTIQNAFRDVDDALAAIQSKTDLVASLERRVDALRRAVDLARERYDNGYADYLEVLDTERGLFSAELALSSARGDRYRASVALYQALGGDGGNREMASRSSVSGQPR
ncbi:efflux transporter outer membrane subunit [Stenotrophomonas sp. SAM-B]|uniref:efflux transporter outer membrane subunit n=1 Tax=Stenotrophomonas sp. SAM-B TaxID=2729141 RepID=UPI00159F93C5|nr:efflux transporter outer membrane subunit [Stenotrophomonas sp. SAM-B]NWF32545.1 efflux transporter outer membrane subunit [Stenotrophomonas sp. SAM-B]